MKRLFIAIDLSDNQDINRVYTEVKKKLSKDKIKWIKPENMHITLKFLGSTPQDKVEKIAKVMRNTCQDFQNITLDFSKIGIFGSRYKPRVIWLGFKENHELSALAEQLINNLIDLGYPIDRQNFVPHLTLGRINKIQSKSYFQYVLDGYKCLNFDSLEINKIYLLESVLQKEGPEYRVIEEVKL